MVQGVDIGVTREQVEQLIEQKVTAKLERYIKEDKEFKRKLILTISQLRDSQLISQEGFDKLNTLLQDFIEGDRATLNDF